MTPADIEGLRARLEGATGPDRELDARIEAALSGWPSDCRFAFSPDSSCFRVFRGDAVAIDEARGNYTTSLEFALGLVERVLPGWGCTITCALGGGATATLFDATGREYDINGDANIGLSEWLDQGKIHAPTAALALCRALMSALAAGGYVSGSESKPSDQPKGEA
jgi:hypothetical protein